MLQFSKKLHYMKGMIKEWNTKVFKNVFKQKQDVSEKLDKVNSIIIQKCLSPKLYHEQKILERRMRGALQ